MTTTTRLLRRYRKLARDLANLERSFDAFVRGHPDQAQRNAYAEAANKRYFAIKAEMADIKVQYQMHRSANLGLVSC